MDRWRRHAQLWKKVWGLEQQWATRASKVAPVDKLSLVLVAIFAVMFLHERPSVREWLGICMVGVGVIILGFKR